MDASIILAVILGEEERSEIVRVSSGYALIAPKCISWEVGNALSACLKRRRFKLSDVLVAWETFESISLKMPAVDISKSLELSARFNLYAYDSYYLQAALVSQIPLLTLDQRMLEVAKDLNIKLLEV